MSSVEVINMGILSNKGMPYAAGKRKEREKASVTAT